MHSLSGPCVGNTLIVQTRSWHVCNNACVFWECIGFCCLLLLVFSQVGLLLTGTGYIVAAFCYNLYVSIPQGALFQSPHGDENDVQTISHRCDVLPYMEYNQKKVEAIRRGNGNLLDSEELYYLAGNYDPSSNHISYEQHVMG